MSDCCSPKGYRWVFSEGRARSEARQYRRKGLDSVSRQIVDFLKQEGVQGRTVLEVGGGIGAIQLELLKAGAARASCVELTPTYEEVAAALVRELGFEDRVDRRVMDFAEGARAVDGADIVILNRVICCYPDMPKLAGAAADHARQLLVLSYPRGAWWTRFAIGFLNLVLFIARQEFRAFVHPPSQIIATTEQKGLKAILDRAGIFWTVAALRRAA